MADNDVRPAVGQVWESNDRRMQGRDTRFEIVGFAKGGYAVVENLNGPPRRRKIDTMRLRPTSTGYRLVPATACRP